jgi:hypothetical protein
MTESQEDIQKDVTGGVVVDDGYGNERNLPEHEVQVEETGVSTTPLMEYGRGENVKSVERRKCSYEVIDMRIVGVNRSSQSKRNRSRRAGGWCRLSGCPGDCRSRSQSGRRRSSIAGDQQKQVAHPAMWSDIKDKLTVRDLFVKDNKNDQVLDADAGETMHEHVQPLQDHVGGVGEDVPEGVAEQGDHLPRSRKDYDKDKVGQNCWANNYFVEVAAQQVGAEGGRLHEDGVEDAHQETEPSSNDITGKNNQHHNSNMFVTGVMVMEGAALAQHGGGEAAVQHEEQQGGAQGRDHAHVQGQDEGGDGQGVVQGRGAAVQEHLGGQAQLEDGSVSNGVVRRRRKSVKKRLIGIEPGIVQLKITNFILKFPNLKQGGLNIGVRDLKRKSVDLDVRPQKQARRE